MCRFGNILCEGVGDVLCAGLVFYFVRVCGCIVSRFGVLFCEGLGM